VDLSLPLAASLYRAVIGCIRRDRLDHVIAFRESSLRKILSSYFDYYHRSKTHLSLGKDSPELRAIQPPEMGSVVSVPQVGWAAPPLRTTGCLKKPKPIATRAASLGAFEICAQTVSLGCAHQRISFIRLRNSRKPIELRFVLRIRLPQWAAWNFREGQSSRVPIARDQIGLIPACGTNVLGNKVSRKPL